MDLIGSTHASATQADRRDRIARGRCPAVDGPLQAPRTRGATAGVAGVDPACGRFAQGDRKMVNGPGERAVLPGFAGAGRRAAPAASADSGQSAP
jgi:hypothetical protein